MSQIQRGNTVKPKSHKKKFKAKNTLPLTAEKKKN